MGIDKNEVFMKVAIIRAARLWKCLLGELPWTVNKQSTKHLNGLTNRSNRWINYWNGLAIHSNRWINYSNRLAIHLNGWIKQYIHQHALLGFLGFNIISAPWVTVSNVQIHVLHYFMQCKNIPHKHCQMRNIKISFLTGNDYSAWWT